MERIEREAHLRDLFPTLTEEKLAEVRDFLDGYCEILLRIYTRMERDRQEGFDDPLSSA